MSKEQFIIVGAQRSGTTYLYTVLDEHSEICMAKPVKPEPKYFLQDNIDIDIDKYYTLYYKDCIKSTKIFGEKSTSYYESEKVAQKLSINFPMVKIVFILANPVDRAISNYKFSYENSLETRTFEEVFIDKKEIDITGYTTSVNPFAYKVRGIYSNFLEYYYNYFPSENIKVIIKENFTNNLQEIQSLYKFLGVDHTFVPNSYDKVINKSKDNIDKNSLSKVKIKLAEYYKEYNLILSKKYKLDVSVWSNE